MPDRPRRVMTTERLWAILVMVMVMVMVMDVFAALLDGCDCSQPTGLHDYASLTPTDRLGLRFGEVAAPSAGQLWASCGRVNAAACPNIDRTSPPTGQGLRDGK